MGAHLKQNATMIFIHLLPCWYLKAYTMGVGNLLLTGLLPSSIGKAWWLESRIFRSH